LKNRKTFFFVLAIFLLVGCGREEKIEVYQAPKEIFNVPALTNPLRWKLPEGWKEKPVGDMRLASFSAHTNHGEADVSIVTLPGEAGGLLANVNRWRAQLELLPLTEQELLNSDGVERKKFSGQEMMVVDFADAGLQKRMLGALFLRQGNTWFFKLTGEANTVTEVKETFLNFLNQLEFV
jgi:hypothetical protein